MRPPEQVEILVVEEEEACGASLGAILKNQDQKVTAVKSGKEALSLLEERHFPIILSTRKLGPEDLTLLDRAVNTEPPSIVVFFTSDASVDTAVAALQKGAFDYIHKPSDPVDFGKCVEVVIARATQHLRVLQGQVPITPANGESFTRTIIGKSARMADIYKIVAKASMSTGNVLITGESGTGKELVARAIHENSARAQEPFVVVNCSALAETLLESELFGHVKGAFTGAVSKKIGLFQLANRGTIFLDEIGEISPAVQVSLLRVIQEGEVKPVGGTETQTVDVRVITATNRNLLDYTKQGRFRDDLYYRLKVIHIDMPPLRERMGDLPDLVDFFLMRSAKKMGKNVLAVAEEGMPLLRAYPWPGNIRELENALEFAVTMTNTTILYPNDFPEEIRAYSTVDSELSKSNHTNSLLPLHALERIQILKALKETGYNKSKAAELLGIDRVTLYRKTLRHGISIRKSVDRQAV